MRRWLTPKEAAEYMPQCARIIRRKCAQGKLPARKTFGRWEIDMLALGYYEKGMQHEGD